MSRIETRVRKLEEARWTGRVPCCVVCVEPGETKEQAVERHLLRHSDVAEFTQRTGRPLIIIDDFW